MTEPAASRGEQARARSEAQSPGQPEAVTPTVTARRLLRSAWKATLATLDPATGAPYASLVSVATEPDGTPLLLLSDLAIHTRNALADQRASLLLDATADSPRALTGARLTLVGRLAPLASGASADPVATARADVARRRYLARQPAARQFVDFADFRFYALDVDWGHLVAGFGRIDRLRREQLIEPVGDAELVVAAEDDILTHMNADHAVAIAAMATGLAGAPAGDWRMLGCDPDGIDLAADDQAVRLEFPRRATSPEAVRRALIELSATARERLTQRSPAQG